jgi:hypothetical protein
MNKLERWVLIFLLAGTLTIVASCGLMSPQQQSEALAAVDEMLKNGAITPEQYAALREGILSASTSGWWQQVVGTVVAAGLAYVGVQVRRGPVATTDEREHRLAARAQAAKPI